MKSQSKLQRLMALLYDNRTLVMTWYTACWAFWLTVFVGIAGCTVTEFKGSTSSGTKAVIKTVSQDVKQDISLHPDSIEVSSDIRTTDLDKVIGGLK